MKCLTAVYGESALVIPDGNDEQEEYIGVTLTS